MPQIFRQIEATHRFQQQAEAIAALDHGKRRFGRSQQLHPLIPRREGRELSCKTFRGRPVARRNDQARQPSERRIEGTLARFDLARIKRLAIAGDQGLHHGMFRLMGLQVPDAAALVAAGAPNHLVEQLPGPLGGARIAIAKAKIGIDHADQIESRKMMALGH